MSSAWPPPQPPPHEGAAPLGAPGPPPAPTLTCYRHPRAEAPVACNRCDRPICTDCMVSAPVGWQCPACVKGGPAVTRMRDVGPGGSLTGERPYVTLTLMGACILAFLAQMADASFGRYAITGLGVSSGRLEQLFTAAFLHGDLIHIGFNMVLLYQLGSSLEHRLGRLRFASLYVAGILGGAVGVLLLTDPRRGSVGASGAVFALMGAVLVLPRRSRYGIEGSIGVLVGLNLAISFVPGLNISLGGHLGGLAAGLLVGLFYRALDGTSPTVRTVAGTAFAVSLAVALFVAAVPVAEWAVQRRFG